MASNQNNPYRQRTHPSQSLGVPPPQQPNQNQKSGRGKALAAGIVIGRVSKRKKKR